MGKGIKQEIPINQQRSFRTEVLEAIQRPEKADLKFLS